MNLFHFMRGGMYLGQAFAMQKAGFNKSEVMQDAAKQFNASGAPVLENKSSPGKNAASAALGGDIGLALKSAQAVLPVNEAGYHAVSCGWWLGQAYGSCKYELKDIPSSELSGYATEAGVHAKALSKLQKLKWSKEETERKFGRHAANLAALDSGELPSYADILDRFAAEELQRALKK